MLINALQSDAIPQVLTLLRNVGVLLPIATPHRHPPRPA